MNGILDYRGFQSLPIDEKVAFIDGFIEENTYTGYTAQQSKLLLQNIITSEPNSYLQEQALKVYSGLVLHNFLKGPALIGTLIEDIGDDATVFVHTTRLRLLFLHFDTSPDAVNVFERLTHHVNADVASEALYRRGLLAFLGLPSEQNGRFVTAIQKCRQYFDQAVIIAENRVDASYYATVCELILCLIGNEKDEFAPVLHRCLDYLWKLKLFSDGNYEFDLGCKIGLSLNLLIDLVSKINEQSAWVDYQTDLAEVYDLHQRLMATEIEYCTVDQAILKIFKTQVSSYVIAPIFKTNLEAIGSKIQVLLLREQSPEFYQYLTGLQETLNNTKAKKNDSPHILAIFARRFTNLPLDGITQDLSSISMENPSDIVALIDVYTNLNDIKSITGYPQGDEILRNLFTDMASLLPSYPKHKLASFSIVLSSVIAYVIRTMQDKKEFFPELYDASLAQGRTEHIFQESLYRNLRQSQFGSRYLYEPNQSGGGRIDITYNEDGFILPIEVKKTATLPTWDSIKVNYLAQAQTYSNAYDQLGIFVVFDLSVKTMGNAPINDIRELFKLQSLEPHLSLGNRYPNGIVCVIVPANKVSPSSMSTYR